MSACRLLAPAGLYFATLRPTKLLILYSILTEPNKKDEIFKNVFFVYFALSFCTSTIKYEKKYCMVENNRLMITLNSSSSFLLSHFLCTTEFPDYIYTYIHMFIRMSIVYACERVVLCGIVESRTWVVVMLPAKPSSSYKCTS